MKRILFLFLAIVLFSFEMKGQTTIPLPDTNFVRFLSTHFPLTVSGNKLILSEAAKVKRSIICTNRNLRNVQGIQYFTHAPSVDLSNNFITSLPDFLPNDTLFSLVLNNNQLTHLPDLSKLSKLFSLDIVANQLTQLNGIEKVKSLQKLICNENALTQLPVLDSLPNLVALDASHNKISRFPSISKVNKIQVLHLNDNLLATLPERYHFTALNKLFLSNNYLSFTELVKLTAIPKYDTLCMVGPQFSLKDGRMIETKEYASLFLSCHTDSALSNVIFSWYKEGDVQGMGQTLALGRASFSHSGKYVCALRHPAFKFTLFTDTIYVSVVPCIDIAKISFTTISNTCKRSGEVKIQDRAQQQLTYILKSTATSHHYSTTSGHFFGLAEPTYTLLLKDANGCEKPFPKDINVPKEECKQALITPNGDGESDSFYFTHSGSVTIYDKRGEIVKVLSIPNEWDGAAKNGKVAPGAYLADINNGEELMNISVVY